MGIRVITLNLSNDMSRNPGNAGIALYSALRARSQPRRVRLQYAKTNGIAKKPLKQNESLRERVEMDLAAIKFNPALVRSFFKAPSVAYAGDS